MAQVLQTCVNDEILVDATWALSYCSDGGHRTVPHIMQTGITGKIIELMAHQNSTIAIPALRACGNFVTGSDDQTETVIHAGVLPVLDGLMSHAENMIRKEAVWTLSNICAGNESQVKLIIELGIIDKLVQMTFSDVLDVQRESVWSLSNCTALKQPDIIRVLVEKDIIKAMSTWLEKNDSKTLVVILEGLTNILHVGKSTFGHSVFQDKVEECGALDSLENLQEYPNQHVYELAIGILETYFQLEEIDLSSNLNKDYAALNFS